MIGKVGIGKSFRGCIQYLFNGRLQENGELQLLEAANKNAVVIAYNMCYGNPKQLVRDFIEVCKLNSKVSKPVFHFSLSFALGDAGKLDLQDKAEIAEKLAKEFNLKNNQYLVIAHKDTGHEHLHIVANRIGFDGKTASDSNSYKRMAAYCRQMELEYNLATVLSPNRFLKPEQRTLQAHRLDHRKELLKQHLTEAIRNCNNLHQVKVYMEKQGYAVELGRGIAFTDQQHVRFKGSQVGYALATLEKKIKQAIQLKQQQELLQKQQNELINKHKQVSNHTKGISL